MKIDNLQISRRTSYDDDYPNMLVGTVQVKGPDGKMEIKLSNGVVSQIFLLIKEDVQRVADENAAKVEHAVQEAADESPLLEASNG